MTGKAPDRRLAWHRAGYRLFAESGYAALSLDELIVRTGFSRRDFYDLFSEKERFFQSLVREHRKQIIFLYPRLRACSAYVPDLFDLLAGYPTEIRFHRQLLLTGKGEASLRIYHQVNTLINSVAFPLWAEHVGYYGDPEEGKSFHLTLLELWLLQLDPQNITSKTMMEHAENINHWLVLFRDEGFRLSQVS